MLHLKCFNNYYFTVTMSKRKLYSTTEQPCVEDKNYDPYKCMESVFSRQRGCQYPWNIYNDLGVPVCSNYGEVAEMLKHRDRNQGHWRHRFNSFERLVRTKMACPQPCEGTKYSVEVHNWKKSKTGFSIQISLSDSLISHEEQYLSCDMHCIIGEFGGNLGFFLGGSLLFGLDIVLQYCAKALSIIYYVWNTKSIRL